MSRRLVILIALLLACLSLVAGAVLTPAHASQPKPPAVTVNTSSRPLTCIIGIFNRGICLTLS